MHKFGTRSRDERGAGWNNYRSSIPGKCDSHEIIICLTSGIINDGGNFKAQYLVIRPAADAGLLSPTDTNGIEDVVIPLTEEQAGGKLSRGNNQLLLDSLPVHIFPRRFRGRKGQPQILSSAGETFKTLSILTSESDVNAQNHSK
ncbi:hypothetical protein DV515_00000825 [Chloebia gouldiae]|uniref:Uncharacterized protein n=1 Tax=Chloebia gouldiae TaxID=44316 RepID=A0A3L8T094_CHLGU|nr:hypothetical protein DV515_00000825 [Chloebia gouldiae]